MSELSRPIWELIKIKSYHQPKTDLVAFILYSLGDINFYEGNKFRAGWLLFTDKNDETFEELFS